MRYPCMNMCRSAAACSCRTTGIVCRSRCGLCCLCCLCCSIVSSAAFGCIAYCLAAGSVPAALRLLSIGICSLCCCCSFSLCCAALQLTGCFRFCCFALRFFRSGYFCYCFCFRLFRNLFHALCINDTFLCCGICLTSAGGHTCCHHQHDCDNC